ncbi:hypothetical protein [Streptomyces carpinensis]|uniref:hypothetical protein n=1 Tax=Streptomyces carpinensis TaxID=66369 RepID=UPI000A3A65E6
MENACNLGRQLGSVLGEGAPESLPDTWEERRRVAAHMLGLSARVYRGEVRRGMATRQLGGGYRESPVTAQTRTGTTGRLRAGAGRRTRR